MGTKNIGVTASNAADLITKGDLTTALAAADGTGLAEASGVLSVNLPIRTVPVAFHIPGVVTTGVKTPRFICPVTGTLDSVRAMLSSGSGCAVRMVRNGSAVTASAASSVGTSVVTTTGVAQSVSAGDYIQLEVTTAGTAPVDLSVTAAIVVT